MTSLLLSENFPPRTGGSGRWFWEIYRRLPRESFIVAAGRHPDQEAFDQTHDLRLYRLALTMKSWGVLSLRGLAGYWRSIRAVRRVALADRVEKIHCGRCIPEGVICLALKRLYRLPYLCYVHGEDVNTASCSREHTWLVRRVLHGAEFLIANSHNTKRILLDEWALPASHVHVLHPGVDTEYFTSADHDSTVRDRLGWRERPVILTVGRLQRRKGHDVMIRALSSIRQAVPDVLYAIVGDGEERPRLAEMVEEEGLAGHVQFLGEVSDAELLQCYQQCDVFVLPNRQVGKDIEGFGMVLLEAQACAKAVVAGMSGGTSETMRVPETGRVVDCAGPEPLAALLTEMLADRTLLQRMGSAARSWVVDHFDWAVLCRQARRLFHVQPGSQTPRSPVEPVFS